MIPFFLKFCFTLFQKLLDCMKSKNNRIRFKIIIRNITSAN
jgi:hypothetical protein